MTGFFLHIIKMDQRTRRKFVETIESFFPRELCGEMDDYPTFNTSLKSHNAGLNSDLVCGTLKDAVKSGEHIVKCFHMPAILIERIENHNGYRQEDELNIGCWFMLSNKNRIVIYKPCTLRRRNDTSMANGWSQWWPWQDAKWDFHQLAETLHDDEYKCFDFVVQDYMSRYGKHLQDFRPSYKSISKALILSSMKHDRKSVKSINECNEIASPQNLLTTYEKLLEMIHGMTPHQQRIVRQRQRIIGQSSDRIGRSLTRIRSEFERLETEMKKLGELSSALPIQKTTDRRHGGASTTSITDRL